MNRIFSRLRGAVRRKPRNAQTRLDDAPYSNRKQGRSRENEEDNQLDDHEDIIPDDDERSLEEFPQRTSRKQPTRGTLSNENSPPTRFTAPDSSLQNISNDFQTNLPRPNNNNDLNRNTNLNTFPTSNPPVRTDLPITERFSTPPQQPLNDVSIVNDPNRTSLPPPLADNTLHLRNKGFESLKMNPRSTLAGFPATRNSHLPMLSSWTNRNGLFRGQNRFPMSSRFLSFRNTENIPDYQFDYPIENVFIDENIPSSMAIKINEAVERDRFGHVYKTHHYAYKPNSQQITIGRDVNLDRSFNRHSYPNGLRYVREITNENSYSQDEIFPICQVRNPAHFQLIIEETPQFNCEILSSQYDRYSFPTSVQHFTALALPNDPMRRNEF